MIVLYGGRVTIFRNKLSENWRVRLKVPGHQQEYDLCTPDVRQAYIRSQAHYTAWKNKNTIDEALEQNVKQRKCWDCIHWSALWNECSLGFPEARKSNGTFGARCSLHDVGSK